MWEWCGIRVGLAWRGVAWRGVGVETIEKGNPCEEGLGEKNSTEGWSSPREAHVGRRTKGFLGGRHPLSECASEGRASPRARVSYLEGVVRPRAEDFRGVEATKSRARQDIWFSF